MAFCRTQTFEKRIVGSFSPACQVFSPGEGIRLIKKHRVKAAPAHSYSATGESLSAQWGRRVCLSQRSRLALGFLRLHPFFSPVLLSTAFRGVLCLLNSTQMFPSTEFSYPEDHAHCLLPLPGVCLEREQGEARGSLSSFLGTTWPSFIQSTWKGRDLF